jgi:hypothetical protein
MLVATAGGAAPTGPGRQRHRLRSASWARRAPTAANYPLRRTSQCIAPYSPSVRGAPPRPRSCGATNCCMIPTGCGGWQPEDRTMPAAGGCLVLLPEGVPRRALGCCWPALGSLTGSPEFTVARSPNVPGPRTDEFAGAKGTQITPPGRRICGSTAVRNHLNTHSMYYPLHSPPCSHPTPPSARPASPGARPSSLTLRTRQAIAVDGLI